MKVFIFDSAKCNGCYGCQLACKDEHCGNDWSPYAKSQPETGHFWMSLKETEHGQIPKVKIEYKPIFCQHCDDAPCITAGNGAVYKREDGLVIIDPVKAQGNYDLVKSCPYGAIYWNTELEIAQKCTGCAHLIDKGEQPRCVDFCSTGGLLFGEEEIFVDEIAKAELLQPELGTKPRVYYSNLPKLFISGEVWDPVKDLIIKGAKVTLTDANDYTAQTTTDGFGDFWFKKLEAGNYTLSIEAEGFVSKKVENIDLRKSLNIGDFPLEMAGEAAVVTDAQVQTSSAKTKSGTVAEVTKQVVTGIVYSSRTKEPMYDAIVNLRGVNVYKTTTNAEGIFKLEVPQGKYLVNIKSAGYKSYGQNIEVKENLDCGEIILDDAKPMMTSFSAFDAHDSTNDIKITGKQGGE